MDVLSIHEDAIIELSRVQRECWTKLYGEPEMNTDKVRMLQRKAAQAANFAMLCVEKLDPEMPWQEYLSWHADACEYQRQAKFLSACARQEMGVN